MKSNQSRATDVDQQKIWHRQAQQTGYVSTYLLNANIASLESKKYGRLPTT